MVTIIFKRNFLNDRNWVCEIVHVKFCTWNCVSIESKSICISKLMSFLSNSFDSTKLLYFWMNSKIKAERKFVRRWNNFKLEKTQHWFKRNGKNSHSKNRVEMNCGRAVTLNWCNKPQFHWLIVLLTIILAIIFVAMREIAVYHIGKKNIQRERERERLNIL